MDEFTFMGDDTSLDWMDAEIERLLTAPTTIPTLTSRTLDEVRTTDQMLPYGARFSVDGTRRPVILERRKGPHLWLDSGAVGFGDPVVGGTELVGSVNLNSCLVRSEIGTLRIPDPGARGQTLVRTCTVAVGETRAVQRWRRSNDTFTVRGGLACVADMSTADKLDRLLGDPVRVPFLTERHGFSPITERRDAVGLVFDCGMGDGQYNLWVGYDDTGRVVAVAADLQLHRSLRRA